MVDKRWATVGCIGEGKKKAEKTRREQLTSGPAQLGNYAKRENEGNLTTFCEGCQPRLRVEAKKRLKRNSVPWLQGGGGAIAGKKGVNSNSEESYEVRGSKRQTGTKLPNDRPFPGEGKRETQLVSVMGTRDFKDPSSNRTKNRNIERKNAQGK